MVINRIIPDGISNFRYGLKKSPYFLSFIISWLSYFIIRFLIINFSIPNKFTDFVHELALDFSLSGQYLLGTFIFVVLSLLYFVLIFKGDRQNFIDRFFMTNWTRLVIFGTLLIFSFYFYFLDFQEYDKYLYEYYFIILLLPLDEIHLLTTIITFFFAWKTYHDFGDKFLQSMVIRRLEIKKEVLVFTGSINEKRDSLENLNLLLEVSDIDPALITKDDLELLIETLYANIEPFANRYGRFNISSTQMLTNPRNDLQKPFMTNRLFIVFKKNEWDKMDKFVEEVIKIKKAINKSGTSQGFFTRFADIWDTLSFFASQTKLNFDESEISKMDQLEQSILSQKDLLNEINGSEQILSLDKEVSNFFSFSIKEKAKHIEIYKDLNQKQPELVSIHSVILLPINEGNNKNPKKMSEEIIELKKRYATGPFNLTINVEKHHVEKLRKEKNKQKIHSGDRYKYIEVLGEETAISKGEFKKSVKVEIDYLYENNDLPLYRSTILITQKLTDDDKLKLDRIHSNSTEFSKTKLLYYHQKELLFDLVDAPNKHKFLLPFPNKMIGNLEGVFSLTPFFETNEFEFDGIYLGKKENNNPVWIDLERYRKEDTKEGRDGNTSSHLMIFGKTGSGKGYVIESLMAQYYKTKKLYVLDITGEYNFLVEKPFNGVSVNVYDTDVVINPFEYFSDSSYQKHRDEFLLDFFKTYFDIKDNTFDSMIKGLIDSTYKSVKGKLMPTMDAFKAQLELDIDSLLKDKKAKKENLETYKGWREQLGKDLAKGSDWEKKFNRKTNIDLSNDIIRFNLSALNTKAAKYSELNRDDLLATKLFIEFLTQTIYSREISHKKTGEKEILLISDESQVYVNLNLLTMLKLLSNVVSRGRKLTTDLCIATQNISHLKDLEITNKDVSNAANEIVNGIAMCILFDTGDSLKVRKDLIFRGAEPTPKEGNWIKKEEKYHAFFMVSSMRHIHLATDRLPSIHQLIENAKELAKPSSKSFKRLS